MVQGGEILSCRMHGKVGQISRSCQRRSTVGWAFIESKQKRYVQAVIPICGVCDARVKVPGYTPTGIWIHPCSWRRPGNRSVHLVCTHLVLYLRFTSSRRRRLRRSGSVNLSHPPSASPHSSGLAMNKRRTRRRPPLPERASLL